MITYLKFALLASIYLVSFSPMFACVDYDEWQGDVSSDWNNASNWEGNSLPTSSQAARIDPDNYTNAPVISSNSSFTPRYLAIEDEAVLTINANVGASRNTTVSGGATVIVSGGTWTVQSGYPLEIIGDNTEVIVSGGTVYAEDDIEINGDNDGFGASPSLTINSGNVIIDDDLIFARHPNDQPELNMTGGILTISGDIVNSNTNINLNISGGTLNLDGDFELSNVNDEINMNAGSLEITGDWDVSGLATMLGGTVTLAGTGPQSITNSSGGTFHNLIINNTGAGVTLVDPISVSNTLTLTDGLLISSATDRLTIEDDATVIGANNASFVDGWCRKRGNDAFTFPVGDGSTYRPITMSAPSSITDEFTATYYYTDPDNLYSTASLGSGLNHISTEEYWELNRDAGSSSVSVTLHWDENSGTIVNPSQLLVARWNGSHWESHGNGGTTGDTNTGTVISSAAITNFSPFAIGSSSSINILPVKWLNFSANAFQDEVVLNWATASEQQNSHFEIERSLDGHSFEKIGEVDSRAGQDGNSNEELNYGFNDKDPVPGVNYYRIKQVDLDGKYDFTKTEPVEVFSTSKTEYPDWTVECFRGPNSNTYQLIFPEDEAMIDLKLVNTSGGVVSEQALKVADGQSILQIPPGISEGIYLVQITAVSIEGQKEKVLKLPIFR